MTRTWGARGFVAVGVLLCAVAARAAENATVCVTCHADTVGTSLSTGGHGVDVDCLSCHAERRPGRVGPRHRSTEPCRGCHEAHGDVIGHPPRQKARGVRRETRNCVACHAQHGSPNADLIQTAIPRGGRRNPITFTDAGGTVPGGFVDPAHPGRGLCEVCHRTTEFYRADGRGEPHFTQTCTLCHFHDQAFQPVAAEANCSVCHAEQAAAFQMPSGHSAQLECTGCHASTGVPPGPGHETVPACQQCHAQVATHAPPGRAPFACTTCHDPHGTGNIELVLDTIITPQGSARPIVFENLVGKADGSFASASAPGTGVCEICHTTTRYYRADGGGEPHFTFSCLPCHLHERGFQPQ